jgi:serine protease Do
LQLGLAAQGVLVESVERAGWADLGGLKADDLIKAVGETEVGTLDEYRRARDAVVASDRRWLVLLVQRGGQTVFVEINLKPLHS